MKFRSKFFYGLFILIIAILGAVGFERALRYLAEITDGTKLFDTINLVTLGARILFYFIAGIIFLYVLIRSDNHNTKLPWIFFIFLNPILGVVIFLNFSNNYKKSFRYRKRKNEIEEYKYIQYDRLFKKQHQNIEEFQNIPRNFQRIFETSNTLTHHNVYVANSTVEPLINGDKFFPRLASELKKANEYILMMYYIIKTDETGREILNILREKARQGIKVKLMYDGLGSRHLNRKFMNSLKDSGVEVICFDKIRFPLFNSKLNNRNHKKLIIIDGKMGFNGGMNLGDEYNHKSKKMGFWRDDHIMIKGIANASLLDMFNKDYYYCTGKFLDPEIYKIPNVELKSDNIINTIQSGPDSRMPLIRDVYIKAILNAKKSIKIASPYLILDSEILSALRMAALSNVNIEVIIPGKADKKLVYKCSESFIHYLLEVGIKVYKLKDTFIHSKILIIDDELASVGSFNMDVRSFIIDFEATTLFSGSGVSMLVDNYKEDIKKSIEIKREDWEKRNIFRRLFEGIMNLFAPVM